MAVIETKIEDGLKSYRILNILYLIFSYYEWLISFWIINPKTEQVYICGGFGFWRFSLSVDLDFTLDAGIKR